jgi:integrase
MREAALSPSTIRGYRIIQENRMKSVMDRTINKTTDKMYQLAVNADTKEYSSKTVKNTWCFVASVLKAVAGREVSCSIPQVITKEHEFLEPEHIPIFLKGIKGDPREIPILLALHGLRASEVMDITWKDIDLKKKIIRVRGSAVLDADNNIVHKETNKNSTSRRDVPILIPQLVEAVERADKSSEFVYDKQTVTIYRTINKVCRENGLPEVGVHGLRHSWTSLCFHLGLPAELTQKFGGWGDLGTMKKIYTHLATRDVHKYTAALEAFFEET